MAASRVPDVLADLHLLTVIAQTRSLTQAARRLGISKASVSTRLRDLERAVGMSLVRRTTRSVTLTPAALQLVDDTQASFARIEQSFEQAKDLAGKAARTGAHNGACCPGAAAHCAVGAGVPAAFSGDPARVGPQ